MTPVHGHSESIVPSSGAATHAVPTRTGSNGMPLEIDVARHTPGVRAVRNGTGHPTGSGGDDPEA